jgi:hypothetical protein
MFNGTMLFHRSQQLIQFCSPLLTDNGQKLMYTSKMEIYQEFFKKNQWWNDLTKFCKTQWLTFPPEVETQRDRMIWQSVLCTERNVNGAEPTTSFFININTVLLFTFAANTGFIGWTLVNFRISCQEIIMPMLFSHFYLF